MMTLTETKAHELHDGKGQAWRYDAAIDWLRFLHHDGGVHLTWEHVEHAARIFGARVDLLREIIVHHAHQARRQARRVA